MPVISGTTNLIAGQVVDNVLTGSQFEFLPFDASLEFGLTVDVAGAGTKADVYSGQDVLLEQGDLVEKAGSPIYPDDFSLTDVAAAGERIKVRLIAPAAAAAVVKHIVRITPL